MTARQFAAAAIAVGLVGLFVGLRSAAARLEAGALGEGDGAASLRQALGARDDSVLPVASVRSLIAAQLAGTASTDARLTPPPETLARAWWGAADEALAAHDSATITWRELDTRTRREWTHSAAVAALADRRRAVGWGALGLAAAALVVAVWRRSAKTVTSD